MDVVRNPIHATGVGLLLYARSRAEKEATEPASSSLREIWERMKSWFQGGF